MIILVCGLLSAYTLVVICRLLMEGVPDKLHQLKTPTGEPCTANDSSAPPFALSRTVLSSQRRERTWATSERG